MSQAVNFVTYSPLAGLAPDETGSAITGTITLTAGTVAFFKAPSGAHGGGVTIVEAFSHIKLGSATTLALVDLGTGGTAVAGTVCTLGAAWANVPIAGTPADYFLGAGKYLGVKWSAGTVTLAPNVVSVGYVMGRAGA